MKEDSIILVPHEAMFRSVKELKLISGHFDQIMHSQRPPVENRLSYFAVLSERPYDCL